MTKTNLLEKFLSRKGQICTIRMEKPLKVRKGFTGQLVKKESTQARAGVNYSNIGEIKDSNKEVQGLPYGEWEIFPYTIKHNGGRQYRFRSMENAKKEIEYFLDGIKIAKEEAEQVGLKSEFRDSRPIVFNVKEENLKEIV